MEFKLLVWKESGGQWKNCGASELQLWVELYIIGTVVQKEWAQVGGQRIHANEIIKEITTASTIPKCCRSPACHNHYIT